MSSSRKKSKVDQIPKPISIKKEKSEEDRSLHPISHYIDDRLELVKQIFGTLKPKTIMNLAPEFLKKTNLDEIEELCLNELLCISTKRLKAIIENTRCPTDTESSEDSDVEHQQEHISLEEISSDSDIDGSKSRRAKKLRKSSAKKANKTNENEEPEGHISVLELLELQARARAIRSQLAMEPITKIEVKSDEDEKEEQKQHSKDISRDKRSGKNSNTNKHKANEATSSKAASSARLQTQTNGSKPQEAAAPPRKIKLKRNYRNVTKSPEKQVEAKSVAVVKESKPEVQNQPDKSRSASPDVIPIPTEPETLLISDSTDDETNELPKKQIEPLTVETQPAVVPAVPVAPAEESEPEEGEVRDENETEPEAQNAASNSEQPAAEDKTITETVETTVEIDKPLEQENIAEEAATKSIDPSGSKDNNEATTNTAQSLNTSAVDDEDQNDDVISIGGDLEHEMIEELAKGEDETNVQVKIEATEQESVADEEDNDVISLNTSDDEHEKLQDNDSESWRTRYLKSSKVSQVLAASRLSNRVRNKIKKSKRAQKHKEAKEADDERASQQQQQFISKHEDGSMEQYQELLQHRQRKSSANGSKGDK